MKMARAPVLAAAAALAALAASAATVQEKLETIVFPSVEFRQAALPDVLEYLRQASRREDPGKTGVEIVARDLPEGLVITLNLRRVRLGDVLRYVAEISGAVMVVDGDRVVLRPGSSPALPEAGPPPPPDPDTLRRLKEIVIPSVEFREASLVDVMSFLRDASEALAKDPAGVNLVLKPGPRGEFPPSHPGPDVDPFAPAMPPGTGDGPGITLQMRRAPLGEVLRQVARLAGMDLLIEGSTVVMAPGGEAARGAVFRTEVDVARAGEAKYTLKVKVYETPAGGKEIVLASPWLSLEAAKEGAVTVGEEDAPGDLREGVKLRASVRERAGGLAEIDCEVTVIRGRRTAWSSRQTTRLPAP
ncbi:MAG: hypothetical protein FJ221_04940 [Lentisphaerae bacterium]|nr:hypothetical protein [Lentisphaerota bacterium]